MNDFESDHIHCQIFEVCDHFGALDIKVLKCQVYLKAVIYINTKERSYEI